MKSSPTTAVLADGDEPREEAGVAVLVVVVEEEDEDSSFEPPGEAEDE